MAKRTGIEGTSLDITGPTPVRKKKKARTQIEGTSLDLTQPPSQAHRIQNAREMVQAQLEGQPIAPVYGPAPTAPTPRIHGRPSQAKSMTAQDSHRILQAQGLHRPRVARGRRKLERIEKLIRPGVDLMKRLDDMAKFAGVDTASLMLILLAQAAGFPPSATPPTQ